MQIIPGLYGFGTDTRAAYGAANDPVIFIVTNTNHSNGTPCTAYRNGTAVKTGSFLEALNYSPPANTGKIILFEVSGTINATSLPYNYDVKHQYTTIAGQTAPSPGITLRNIHFQVRNSDVLIQHFRSRVGDGTGHDPGNRRSITIKSTSTQAVSNVVADHITATWGIDTCFTVWENASQSISNITIANCLIAEGLHDSIHPDGVHSKGLALQVRAKNISAIKNLMMSNNDRNPYVRWGSKVAVNNMTYNAAVTHHSVTAYAGSIDYAAVGNVIKSGPSTAGWGDRGFILLYNDPEYSVNWDNSNIYLLDNEYNGITQASSSDWRDVYNKYGDDMNPYKVNGETPATDAPLWPTGLSPINSSLVKAHTITNAGARPADRDSVDIRLINDVINGTGAIIDSQADVGGWPTLVENNISLDIPANPHVDSGDGYTNLEKWLHGLADEVEGKIPISQPAKGEIINVDYPASVNHGADFDINVVVKNVGAMSGIFKTQIMVDGTILTTSNEFVLIDGETSPINVNQFIAPPSGDSMNIDVKCIRIT